MDNEIYIVTGATGYIGSEVCRQLAAQGKKVRALVRKRKTLDVIPKGVNVYGGNVLQYDSMEKMFQNTGNARLYVIHCAAVVTVTKHDRETMDVNINGTINVIHLCEKYHAKLVYLGSVDALMDKSLKPGKVEEPDEFVMNFPTSDYAYSKYFASKLVCEAHADGLETAILMPSCVIGPGDPKNGPISQTLTWFIKGLLPVAISGGYDLVDVRDVARACIKACTDAPSGAIYIINGEYKSIKEIFAIVAEHIGRPSPKMSLSTKVLRPVAPIADGAMKLIGKKPTFTTNALWLLDHGCDFSHKRAERDLGFHPMSAEQSILDTVDYLIKKGQL